MPHTPLLLPLGSFLPGASQWLRVPCKHCWGHGISLLAAPELSVKTLKRDSFVIALLEDIIWVVVFLGFWVLSSQANDSTLSPVSSPQGQDSVPWGTFSPLLRCNHFNLYPGFTNSNLFPRWPLWKGILTFNVVVTKLVTLWLYD